jgi:hypothetical protein
MISEISLLDLFPATRNVWGASFSQNTGRYRTTHKQKDQRHDELTMGLEETEGDILAFEVSDDVLEIAAGTAEEKANFTLGACTGLSECPG